MLVERTRESPSRYEDQVDGSALLHHWWMTAWVEKAACRRFDPELFFPLGSGPAVTRQAARAKAVCACCEVSRAVPDVGATKRRGRRDLGRARMQTSGARCAASKSPKLTV